MRSTLTDATLDLHVRPWNLSILDNQTKLTAAVFWLLFIMHYLIPVLHLQGQYHQTTRRLGNIKDFVQWVLMTWVLFVVLWGHTHTWDQSLLLVFFFLNYTTLMYVHSTHKGYCAAFMWVNANYWLNYNIKVKNTSALLQTNLQK